MTGKGPREHYNELESAIEAVDEQRIAPINMEPAEAAHEGERVAALAEKYRDKLVKSDIKPELLDTANARAEAYAYTVSLCDSQMEALGDNKALWIEQKLEGYAIRKKAGATVDYIFRNDNRILDQHKKIKQGRGDLDMIKDLLSYSQLAEDYKERLLQGKVNFALFTRAQELNKSLSDLAARLAITIDKLQEAETLRAKAWTYLKEALDEIYAAGRYVFMDEPEIEELFYADSLQERARRTANAPTTPQVVAAQ